MGKNVEYCNDKGTKQHENSNHVHFETCGKKQRYTKEDCSKETEENCHTKYVTGGGGRRVPSGSPHRHSRSAAKSTVSSKATAPRGSSPARQSGAGSRGAGCSSVKSAPPAPAPPPARRASSLAQRMSHCYEIKRVGRRGACDRLPCWQHGTYVRDECGSGVVPKRYHFQPSRRLWCRTPLSMYQATIGELARKILCREAVVPRDVRPEPPSNIAEYILPPCRGYYRKYDCLRPCEEEYAVVRAGKKEYRDRVERYWEPCLTKEQKHKLDVNDYAPHNSFLSIKLRRKNVTDDDACW